MISFPLQNSSVIVCDIIRPLFMLRFPLAWLELAGFVEYITRINRVERRNLTLNDIIPWVPLMGNSNIHNCHTLKKTNWRLSSCVWLVFSKKKHFFQLIIWTLSFSNGIFTLPKLFICYTWNGYLNSKTEMEM